MAAPAMRVSQSIASERSSPWKGAMADPAASAAALVVVITMSRVELVRPPATGPAKEAYRPWAGLTPARTLAAMPSGTLEMAPGRPATRSARKCLRRGLTSPTQADMAAWVRARGTR